jgi:hypothetical protein
MRTDLETQLNEYHPYVSKNIKKIVDDLYKIEGFEVISYKEWQSNLPTLLPFIGGRIEENVKKRINELVILMQDQRLRTQFKK